MPYWRRPSPRAPKRDAPVPAAIAMMATATDYADRPLGGYAGERLPSRPAAPQPPAQPVGLHIPPPDWAEEERQRRERDNRIPDTPTGIRGTAVEEMMAAALERGELDEPEPVPVPMLRLPPLQRPEFPAPDWRAEERERAELEAKERAKQKRHARLLELLDEEGT